MAILAALTLVAVAIRVKFEREVDALSASERAEAAAQDAVVRKFYTATQEERDAEKARVAFELANPNQDKLDMSDSGRIRFRRACLEDHMRQLREGTLEGVSAGRLCWYCKRAHSWMDCPHNTSDGRRP